MELNVDWLQKNSKMTVSLGLGFVLVKLSDSDRLHFYHPECKMGKSDHPHDHRYDFRSRVLRGALENTIWKVEEGSGWKIHFESCKVNLPSKPPDPCEAVASVSKIFTTGEGSEYQMDMDTFHTIRPLGTCITHLHRREIKKEFARVVVPDGETLACPFGSSISIGRIWEIVEECLA